MTKTVLYYGYTMRPHPHLIHACFNNTTLTANNFRQRVGDTTCHPCVQRPGLKPWLGDFLHLPLLKCYLGSLHKYILCAVTVEAAFDSSLI